MKNIIELSKRIENYFENPEVHESIQVLKDVDETIKLLNFGEIRVSEKKDGKWIVNSWVKKAILLGFTFKKNMKQIYDSYDKLGLLEYDYENPRYRKVPQALVREGVYIGDGAIIMPSYINIGAYIGKGTMIDIGAAIGSCAQIGENCHISANSCIGGVLEPAVANPVIVEDNCFIGVNSSILEGVIVEEGSVIASGVNIASSTKIINRETGEIITGIVPRYSVVVPGSYTSNHVNINCAVIIKSVDENTRAKTSINMLLRDN